MFLFSLEQEHNLVINIMFSVSASKTGSFDTFSSSPFLHKGKPISEHSPFTKDRWSVSLSNCLPISLTVWKPLEDTEHSVPTICDHFLPHG